MNIDPMSEGLIRQRRNVISLACVLVFLKFAKVQIDQLSFLGLSFGKLGNPPAVYLAIWIFFLYFVFRYYQYFSQEGPRKLQKSHYDDLEKRVLAHVTRIAKNIHKNAIYHPTQLISLKNGDWNITITYKKDENDQQPEVENVKYTRKSYVIYWAVSWFNIALNSSAVTDYILPFAVIVFTLIYCFHGTESSLFEAFKNGFH